MRRIHIEAFAFQNHGMMQPLKSTSSITFWHASLLKMKGYISQTHDLLYISNTYNAF